jgi:predicted metal-dependent HD superfamily phosphohydrolase
MDAGSVEPMHIEFDRMRCAACGHEEVCDEHQIKLDWNELVPADPALRERWHVLPSVRFVELLRALGSRGHGRDAFLSLRAAYDEPHRAYHTSRHLGACLRLLDDPEVSALAERPAEVEAAIWWHDAIYDTHARDNEERSAALAERQLGEAGVDAAVVARVASHVRATRDHLAPSADGRLVVDVDLSILGAPPDEFARFEREVRREYAWVDDAAYAGGRAAVLRSFAARPALYGNQLFRDRYETRARANVAASIEALGERTS